MLSDPLGNNRYCFTPLASCIVDTPEACLITCIWGKTSPTTLADYTQFGDLFCHPPWTKAATLSFLESVDIDSNKLSAYFKACETYCLNGIAFLFWRDWPSSDPTHIFPPEILHIFAGFFYDHDMRWCICAIGPAEIDFRFSILQPIMNHRCFTTSITNLKQVTGKTQRDIQQYIIPVIAGATPSHIIRAVRMLLDFHYLVQSPTINGDQCHRVLAALEEFHHHKQSIINAGLCRGEKGNILEHWQIPKLEIMQNVTQSIPLMGPPIHWTADITERAHIDVVKIPATATNNIDFESQICWHLNRFEKCRAFSHALHLRENKSSRPKTDIDLDSSDPDLEDSLEDNESGSFEEPTSSTALHHINDYFACSAKPPLVLPPRSFVSGPVAFHLRFNLVIGSMKICDVAEKYDLQDMRTTLVHYFYCNKGHNGQPLHVGGRRHHPADKHLPFNWLQVWYKVRIQQKAYHDLSSVLPAQTLNASPWQMAGQRDNTMQCSSMLTMKWYGPTAGWKVWQLDFSINQTE